MLTGLLVNSALDQAIVLAPSEEAPPTGVPAGVKFLELRPCNHFAEVPAGTAA